MTTESSRSLAVPSAERARLTAAQRLLAGTFVAAGCLYLAWRVGTFNPDATVLSAIVYLAEVFGYATLVLHLAVCWTLRRRAPPPLPPNTSVTVLVPTRDESVDVVRRTLMAAHQMKHAHEVWLLDDGNRLEMHVLAEELGCRYLARLTDRHGKAGNLNNALKHVRSEYVAVFEAGHAPASSFIDETLGFMADDRVAFVQTSLDFYNLDSFRHRVDRRGSRVWSDQTLLYRVIQAGRDRLGAAMLSGSGMLLRCAALADIGGFAVDSLAPELHTSLRLHKRGWRSVYYAKPLAFGLAAETAQPFQRNQQRWTRGVWQVWREEGALLGRGLTPGQRLCYLSTLSGACESWQRAIVYVGPAVVLATGVLPVATVDLRLLAGVAAYYLLALWVLREIGRGYSRPLVGEQYAMARFAGRLRAAVAGPRDWPQWLVLGSNVAAMVLAADAFRDGRGLPLLTLGAVALCASGVAGLALASIVFTRRRATSRRREYRFPLPVPLRVRSGKDTVIGLATDISPLGCRVVGAPAGAFRSGDELVGELVLPSGPSPVRLVVRTVLVDGQRAAPAALGCEFLWGLSDERSQLELFLFGSDLQWRLNGFDDRTRTPLEWLGQRVRGESRGRRGMAGQRWSPVLYRRVDASQEEGVGFISTAVRDGEERVLVSLGVLPANGRLYAEEVTPMGPRGIVGRVADEQVLETHAAPIYVYRITA